MMYARIAGHHWSKTRQKESKMSDYTIAQMILGLVVVIALVIAVGMRYE